ncbi:MAG: hypothetical protein OEZ34_13395, partial [Spirochaetia bacterium]|nr:hypothetical protein [Spirochaetia bacterium]
EKTSLIKIVKKISEGIRGQLINYERLVLLNQDFSLGLHLTLLDRYTLKNRTLKFKSDDKISEILSKPGNRKVAAEIYSVCIEIATNDLKYGEGTSIWLLTPGLENKEISLSFNALSTHDNSEDGYGTGNISSRINRLNGNIEFIKEREYSIKISVPLAV